MYAAKEIAEFNSLAIRTQADLLAELDALIPTKSHNPRNAYLRDFRDDVAKARIPSLVAPYHSYEIDITAHEAQVYEVAYEDVVIENDEIVEGTMEVFPALVTTKATLLSVEEYAQALGVKPITVRQWIRRGKLRDAIKNGGQWLIPAATERPTRGYVPVRYLRDTDKQIDSALIERFPFLEGADEISIDQTVEDKSRFEVCVYGNHDFKTIVKTSECEELELALVSSQAMRAESSILGISEKSPRFRTASPVLHQDKAPINPSVTLMIVETEKDAELIDPTTQPGAFLENTEESPDIVPFRWNLLCYQNTDPITADENYYDCPNSAERCGTISGYFIDCGAIRDAGGDPRIECDNIDGDLNYIALLLFENDGPLSENGGDPYARLLYIHDIALETGWSSMGVGAWLLRELPHLCRKFFRAAPAALVWLEGEKDKKEKLAEDLYQPAGFDRYRKGSQLFIAYTNL